MSLYVTKKATAGKKTVVLDDMILTKDMPTTAGSKMLEGYLSLFNAEVVEKLLAAGYEIAGKVNVGEFAIDLLGETSAFGKVVADGKLQGASAAVVCDDVLASVSLDVNGTPRRAAAISDKVYIKPTYGTVSRYGTIPAACSGETVGVTAKNADDARLVLSALVGHDDKDGTSLTETECRSVVLDNGEKAKKVAVLQAFAENVDDVTAQKLEKMVEVLKKQGVEVAYIDGDMLKNAKEAWNVLMCAELCNNVSRYDGIKYGYRTKNYSTIDELYTNSRTEAFGELLKTAILYGSDALSTSNYMKVYDKSLRVRRVICEYFAELFAEYDAVMLPACSKAEYSEEDVKNNLYISFDESLYTAPASISGLPAIVVGGVQVIGKAFGENVLFDIAKMFEKEEQK